MGLDLEVDLLNKFVSKAFSISEDDDGERRQSGGV